MTPSVQTEVDGLRARIDVHATRHGLDQSVAGTLEAYLRLLDWEAGNFLPDTAPELVEPNPRLTEKQTHLASRRLGEALCALDLEAVRGARRMADIGSGAGFPGLALAIALPGTRATLVESDEKKSEFLRALSAALGLTNVEVVGMPLQSWTEGVGTCDLVTSRRVWRSDTILERVAPLLAPGGFAVRFAGSRDAEKEALALAAAEANGMCFEQVLPAVIETRRGKLREGKRNLFVYRKVR